MKKVLPILMLIVFLVGCTSTQTLSDSAMQTKVAAILTAPVTATSPATDTPTSTVTPTDTPTDTATVAPTDTPAMTDTPTAAPTSATAQATSSGAPTATVAATSAVPTVNAVTLTPAATATFAPADPRSKQGKPTWIDNMANDQYWPTGATEDTDLNFTNGHMYLKALSGRFAWRLATIGTYNDYYVETTAHFMACSGSDSYGIIFRVPDITTADQGYLFGITCAGKYFLRKWDGKAAPSGHMYYIITDKASPTILAGPNQTNRLGVMAIGSHLLFYINGKYVEDVQDSSYPKGYVGVFINEDNTPNMVVEVDQMAYWLNPAQ
ncbi:MAG TPA: hypothetical protein VKF38_00140 [Anaerolineaceae bacterium]|nr:hypothetical protein [Anaerolineaceae bacterium]